MKLNEVLDNFDTYSLRARIYPALIAALPLALLSVLISDTKPVTAIGPLLLGAGILFLVASIVRSAGQRSEARLASRWDGMPTVRMLRFRQQQNAVTFARRRQALEALINEALPTRRQESADPVKADQAYEAAARRLIAYTRSRPGQFPLLNHENAAYGFARNLLAVKPVAIFVLGVALAWDVVELRRNGVAMPLFLVGSLHLGLVATWLAFIRPAWVKQSADTYAQRLFDVLDQPSTPDPDTIDRPD